METLLSFQGLPEAEPLENGIRPFRLAVPDSVLEDLRNRLAHTRWPDELPEAGADYGVPLAAMKELAEYWHSSYNWREQEALLNAYPQYTVTIDGANIHFFHIQSPEQDAFPLLLTHGWPGSAIEFLDVIGPLTNPRAYGANPSDAFHLVIPSIPGFGLSGPTADKGWNVKRIAAAWAELMHRLGYTRYGTQGGDWGAAISRQLAAEDPEHVCGVHLNYLPFVPKDVPDGLSEEDVRRVAKMNAYLATPAGHMTLQSTRPQTLSFALADSPVGQLAWIADKFAEWTDPACSIAHDRLLTNVMLYWVTGTAASSSRLYYENAKHKGKPIPCPVPVGVAVFPYDLVLPVRCMAERQYDIVHWREFEHGGHFAAMEAPGPFAEDLRDFFRRFR